MNPVHPLDLCPRSSFGLIVLAGSAGALPAYRRILARIPTDFPAAVVVAHHMLRPRVPPLVELLAGHTAARVEQAEQGLRPRPGTVYVVPAGRTLTLDQAARFDLAPATVPFAGADALLTSIASRLGPRCMAVILTGGGADGAAGAAAVRTAGGTVIAQDRESSEMFGMPRAAIERRAADFVFPLDAIGSVIATLVVRPRAAILLGRGSFEPDHAGSDVVMTAH